jgi:hypothetical protein
MRNYRERHTTFLTRTNLTSKLKDLNNGSTAKCPKNCVLVLIITP